jgi:hypothetical protein
MIVSGSSALMIESAKDAAQFSYSRAHGLFERGFCLRYSSMRCAMISVSVSVTK